MPTDFLTIGKKLSKNAWRTAGARFNAGRRLHRYAVSAVFATSALGLVSIVAALFLTAATMGPASTRQLGALVTGVSVAGLVLSLLSYSQNYEVRSVRLRESAEKLNQLAQRIEHELTAKQGRPRDLDPVLCKLRAEYEQIIGSTGDNHSPADDALFRLGHPKEFPETTEKSGQLLLRSYAFPLGMHWALVIGFCAWLVMLFLGVGGQGAGQEPTGPDERAPSPSAPLPTR